MSDPKNHSISVLVVTADREAASSLTHLLASETNPAFTVQSAADLATASARIKDAGPEVVLFDLSLPGLPPGEAFEQFKHAVSNDLPVVALVGPHDEIAGIDAVRCGAKEYVVKGQMTAKFLTSVLRYAINLHHTEETLKKSEERFRVLIENSSDIITIIAADGTMLYESSAVKRVFGYHSRELVGQKIFEYVHPDDREYVTENFKKAIKHRILNQRIEFRFRHVDGSWRIIEAIGSTTLDETHGLIAVVNSRDVTERVQLEEQLLSLSLDDQLTGLLNRRGFLSFGVQQLKLAKRTKQEICLLFADIDRMKEINDTYGHQHGDKILVEVARVLRETYREPDIIGRLGGDEFAVLAIGAAEANAVLLVSRLHARLHARNARKENRELPMSLSLGVVHYDPENPCPIDELLARADTLMYEQKRLKR